MIDHLEPGEVLVFGSNLAGEHYGGAAKQAHEKFGALWGVGEGLTGYTYAFPTLDEHLQRRLTSELEASRDRFYETAREHPNFTFLMTPVGTGIAGYSVKYMRELFDKPPTNVTLPEGW